MVEIIASENWLIPTVKGPVCVYYCNIKACKRR